MNRKIGFIGSGNIGTAMITSVVTSKFAEVSRVYASGNNYSKLEQLQARTGVQICRNNRELVDRSDVVVIAVKPQIVKTVLEEIRENFRDKMLITIAAGVPIKVFEDILGRDIRIFRAMPNLPLLVGEGMTIIASRPGAAQEDIEFCRGFFSIFGKVEEMDESLLGMVISLTASSPAYVFMLVESMVSAYVKEGVPTNLATRIVSQNLLGYARLISDNPSEVSSMKGACIRPELDEAGIKTALAEAIEACNNKARELGNL